MREPKKIPEPTGFNRVAAVIAAAGLVHALRSAYDHILVDLYKANGLEGLVGTIFYHPDSDTLHDPLDLLPPESDADARNGVEPTGKSGW